jgi:hypothetical protein
LAGPGGLRQLLQQAGSVRRSPFERSMPHALLWSASRRDDPEIKWLRDRLRPLVASRVAGFRAGEPAAKRAG